MLPVDKRNRLWVCRVGRGNFPTPQVANAPIPRAIPLPATGFPQAPVDRVLGNTTTSTHPSTTNHQEN